MLDYSIYPENQEKISKIVFLIHGYGSNKDDLINIAPELSKDLDDIIFISPNGPENQQYWGYQWFSLENRDEDVMFQGAEKASIILEKFIQQQINKFNLKNSDIALLGFSQGSMMSMHLGLRMKPEIGGIIGYSGALIAPEKLEESTVSKVPILLVHGDADTVVSPDAMTKAKQSLNKLGIEVNTNICHHLGHGIDAQGIKLAKDFISKIFKKKK
jgi:phospholipase/carboxylesterase